MPADLSDRGKPLGRAEVSIQDVVGFIKLVHKHHPADVLVGGQQGLGFAGERLTVWVLV